FEAGNALGGTAIGGVSGAQQSPSEVIIEIGDATPLFREAAPLLERTRLPNSHPEDWAFAIYTFSEVLSRWNSNYSVEDGFRSVNDELAVAPALFPLRVMEFMDVAYRLRKPQIATLLAPSLAAVNPDLGALLEKRAALPTKLAFERGGMTRADISEGINKAM